MRADSASVGARTPSRRAGAAAGRGSVAVWLFALVGALAAGGVASRLEARGAEFPDAIALYEANRFAEASDAFRALAMQDERRADAWANAGTAAWMAGDTVRAVIGWQRALRLEPDARDVRTNLLLVVGPTDQGVASILPLPRDATTWLALVLWCMAWALYAFVRSDARARGLTGTMLAIAAAAWVGGSFMRDPVRQGARLSVVSASEPMRVAPLPTSDPRGRARTGDLVRRGETRVDEAQGDVWVEVEQADGRVGWLPAEFLQPLYGS
jgi:hypothetical protein